MTDTNRRSLLAGFAGAAALAPFLAIERAMAQMTVEEAMKASEIAHHDLMAVPGLQMHGNEQVAMLLYPGFTALDLVGPHYFFACMMGATVHLVTAGNDLAPVESDLKLAIVPTARIADVPDVLDILFVPGGTQGTLAAMENAGIIGFLKDRGAKARTVVSVCTGSLLLGMAGLLDGRRATSHWVTRDVLAAFGATPVDARVVVDDRVVTGAGVSAGLDLGLALVERLRGRPYAEALMLQAEYAPEPPFPGGTLAATAPAIADPMQRMFSPLVVQAAALAAKRSR